MVKMKMLVKGVLMIVILSFCQCETKTNFFYPPLLTIQEPSIDVNSNSILELTCRGKYPVAWQPEREISLNDTRFAQISSVNTSQSIYKYINTMRLENLEFSDTGHYTCYYEGTTDLSFVENSTSLYVFVNDPFHLFLDNSQIPKHLLIPLLQHMKGIIPCLPTNSRSNVTLWKVEDDGEYQEMVSLGTDVEFDPRKGFIIHYPTYYFSEFFQCRAFLDGVMDRINVTLFFWADTINEPQPFIDLTEARHPVANDTFILKCTVDADPDTRLFVDWSYPNKHEAESRINETQLISVGKVTRGYKHQEVTTYLVVKNAKLNDTGTYVCAVTDHSKKTGTAKIDVTVYETHQPMHVNFTTDIDTAQPIIRKAGQDVKFVITVNAFPSISDVELWWEKNDKKLASDRHYQMRNTTTSATLEIKQIVTADAAVYTLRGRTRDSTSSISIALQVKDVPAISVRNTRRVYLPGEQYTIECHANSYPPPMVWWRWKAFNSSESNNTGSFGGWENIEFNSKFPNGENITLEYLNDNHLSPVSHLHVSANKSGYYMCLASNQMGKSDVLVPFLVTDANDGFELSISNKKPIDEDFVQLECKANIYNFSYIEWKWRPMVSAGELRILKNTSDVSIRNGHSEYSLKSVVSFNPIRMNLSGEYECRAVSLEFNQTEERHITVDVLEIKAPVFKTTNMIGTSMLVSSNALQEFYCKGTGVPAPDIVWRKDGEVFDIGNVTGVEIIENNQRLKIHRVQAKDAGFYECVLQNRGGFVKANITLEVFLDDKALHGLTTGEITAVVVFGIVAIILVLVVSCLVQRIMKEKKQKKELDFISQNLFERGYTDIFNPNLPLEDQIDLLPYKHNFEFPRERLKLGKTLGQGAFGRVVKAEAIGLTEGETSTTVAVKMLKEAVDMEQRKALIAELKILIHIGKHLNIVNLLGAVTKNIAKGELYVMVEYCCYGNLRHFLLKHKGSFIDQLDHSTGQLDPQISTLPGSPFLNMKNDIAVYSNLLGIALDNPTYKSNSLFYADIQHQQQVTDSGTGMSFLTSPSGSTNSDRYLRNSLLNSTNSNSDCTEGWNEDSDRSPFVSTCDLLCFAFQCARGMEYLASRKLIHRDLAARNVLLTKSNVVKICDFGLAKDCYKYSNYIKKSGGLLPVKWMAIESILDRVYTTRSDIWSFGVLLWEMFNMGSNPYPGIEINEDFYKKLKNGYRMESPEFAPATVYKLMKNCWSEDPFHRPDFSEIAETIGTLLESSVRKYYVELNAPYQMMNEELFSNNNDYLKMTGMGDEYTSMTNLSQHKSFESINILNGFANSTNLGMLSDRKDVREVIHLENIRNNEFGEDKDVQPDVTYLNIANSFDRNAEELYENSRNDAKYDDGDYAIPLLFTNFGTMYDD